MIAPVVYGLCAVTAAACAALLWRGWRRTRVRLLLWTCVCFCGLALNNLMLIVDTVVLPDVDLAIPRLLPALAGVLALLYGMIWDSR